MAKEESWRTVAIKHIYDCLLEYEAQQLLLGELIDPEKCLKWIRTDKYPFGMREYSPYNIWLQECKRLKVFLESRQPARYYHSWRSQQWGKKLKAENSNPDQMNLF